ncbi:MAG: hypothetical protein GQ527_09000, partial [Bacteroidales bacterium]|nr:hypothetical protein [Bacteroidales bacterium]
MIFINQIMTIIKSIRFVDAAIFMGAPVMGIILTLDYDRLSEINWIDFGTYFIAIYILAIHVFLINDWGDYIRDLNDTNKTNGLIPTASKKELVIISLMSGLISLILLFLHSFESFFVGVLIIILSTIYST